MFLIEFTDKPTRRGWCQVCGFLVSLNPASGLVRRHRQRRVGPDGPYVSLVGCAGSGEIPDREAP